jgi:chromosome segregation protein
LHREYTRLEARREQTEAESRRLHNEVWETYDMTFQNALSLQNPEYSTAFLRREEKRLKAEIAALGAVNIGAVDAYYALRERYEFLDKQRTDIREAEAQLQEVITQLTEQMEQQFSARFALISKHFSEVFSEMFGGGQAGCSLSSPENILESGIEITARPPGKKLQNLSLLSGGERALTAIALLFGILRLKPSPFCVLDEIESALDDSNIVRFARFLRAHAGDTQFVLITHRKGTMECADTLYGVTTQELGVSKMVSVDFR